MCTPSNSLLYKIYVWDRNLNESKQINTWSSEIKTICYEHNMAHVFDQQQIFPTKSTIKQLKSSMYKMQQQLLKTECENKPKLRTFMLFKDFENLPPHVGKPLSFVE